MDRTIFGFSVLGHVYPPSGFAGWLVVVFFCFFLKMYERLLLNLPYLLSKCNLIIFYGRQKYEKWFNVTTCLLLSLFFTVFCSFRFSSGVVLCIREASPYRFACNELA